MPRSKKVKISSSQPLLHVRLRQGLKLIKELSFTSQPLAMHGMMVAMLAVMIVHCTEHPNELPEKIFLYTVIPYFSTVIFILVSKVLAWYSSRQMKLTSEE